MTVVVHHGPSASSLVTARGEYPIPLTPSGRGLGIVEQLERAAARRAVRAFPIHSSTSPAPEQPRASRIQRGMHMRRLTPIQVAAIRREYVAGASYSDLAKKYVTSKTTVGRLLREAGMTPRPAVRIDRQGEAS